ncbi:hypothetical protein FISHEDRAFT_57781 [Fistulina hepatica ATCC 64428]|uniref:Uncharacterized protein n=1 Tax=Fistulina hepatica ATCC 64428 TaxID=1128425 RepID=A0A0D7AFY6_9AGAR|nr:hypothetical protein FISHEDRAFT_57781 [Fistulina hepatica ATCC 64428]
MACNYIGGSRTTHRPYKRSGYKDQQTSAVAVVVKATTKTQSERQSSKTLGSHTRHFTSVHIFLVGPVTRKGSRPEAQDGKEVLSTQHGSGIPSENRAAESVDGGLVASIEKRYVLYLFELARNVRASGAEQTTARIEIQEPFVLSYDRAARSGCVPGSSYRPELRAPGGPGVPVPGAPGPGVPVPVPFVLVAWAKLLPVTKSSDFIIFICTTEHIVKTFMYMVLYAVLTKQHLPSKLRVNQLAKKPHNGNATLDDLQDTRALDVRSHSQFQES